MTTSANSSDADRERFEQLFASTRTPVLAYLVRRCGDPADAADLLAETYLTVWRRIGDVPADDSARPWVFGVARRTLANHTRHQRVEQRLGESLRTELSIRLAAHHPPEDELVDRVRDGLARLRPRDREVIELAAFDELTPAEIAVVVGRSAGSVRVQLHRVRRAMQRHLRATPGPESPADQVMATIAGCSVSR